MLAMLGVSAALLAYALAWMTVVPLGRMLRLKGARFTIGGSVLRAAQYVASRITFSSLCRVAQTLTFRQRERDLHPARGPEVHQEALGAIYTA